MYLRILFLVTMIVACSSPAEAATWRVGPDPCPAPAAYRPDPDQLSPDARDGLQPAARREPRFWPPAALTVELPGMWAGGSAYLWFDGERLREAAQDETHPPGCSD